MDVDVRPGGSVDTFSGHVVCGVSLPYRASSNVCGAAAGDAAVVLSHL